MSTSVSRILVFILAVAILARAIHGLSSPFCLDENSIACEFEYRSWKEILNVNPFSPTITGSHINQLVGNSAAKIAYHFFGPHPEWVRLPAILFAAAFLFFAARLSLLAFSGFTAVFLFAHLLSNGLVVWFLHSIKGYAPMLLFSSICLYCVLVPSRRERWHAILFFVSGILLTLSHTFGSFYLTFLWLGLLATQRLPELFPEFSTHYHRHLCRIGFMQMPFVLLAIINHARYLHRIGDLAVAKSVFWVGGFPFLFGIVQSNAWPWLVFLLVLLPFVGWSRAHQRLRFVTIFLIITTASFLAMVFLLKVRVLYPRYFLAFLIPLVLYVGEWLSTLWSKRPAMLGLALSFMILVPALDGEVVYGWRTFRTKEFSTFLAELHQTIAHVEDTCFSIVGKGPERAWLDRFYLVRRKREGCDRSFEIQISRTDGIPSFKMTTEEKRLEPLQRTPLLSALPSS